jgi:dTDP-4-amino-4,6-dideoxygalactose transaminase
VLSSLEDAYRSGAWGKYHGGLVERLEQQLATYHDVPHVLTCGSGTFAVELALRALHVGPGDEVAMAAYDYPGNFYAIHAVGATPVLVDVEAANWNLSVNALAAAVSDKTKAVIASHIHGGVVAMADLMEFARSKGVRVVEDAAQAAGAMVEGRRAGTTGDVGVLSFGGSKLLTSGRGGAILTRHADVYQRARTSLHRGNVVCPLSELQAAVLVPQLAKLDERNAHRRRNVDCLRGRLQTLPGLALLTTGAAVEPCYYKLGMQFVAESFGLPRQLLLAALRAEGLAFDEGFRALHIGRSPSRFRRAGDLTEAERAHHGCIVLHHPVLLGSERDMDDIAVAFEKIHRHRERLLSEAVPA